MIARRLRAAQRVVSIGATAMLAAILVSGPTVPTKQVATGAPRPRIAQNAKATRTSRLPALLEHHPLQGTGVLVAQWDEGLALASHEQLAGRVRHRERAEISSHATHVAGTLIGRGEHDSAARGLAIDARLWSYRWSWDALEERAAAPYVAVSAHAYGVALGWAPAGEGCAHGATFFGGGAREDAAFGQYGRSAAELDAVLFETDAISIWAAGNERSDAGPSGGDTPHFHYPDCEREQHDSHADEASERYDTLGGPISAKNAIAVGAVADIEIEPFTAELIVPLAFSSFGPTDDGRIKPDLAASGETIYSALASSDTAYGALGGTSSAAAVVAGGVALLTEHYRAVHAGRDPRAAEIKALLVYSALEAGADPGPDYRLGYGLFDVDGAAQVIDEGDERIRIAAVTPGDDVELTTHELSAGHPVRVTLAWLDPPGDIAAGPADDPVTSLVHDLDVVLIAPDGRAFYPWRLDRDRPDAPAARDAPNRVDTVERIDVAAGDNTASGAWTIRVSASEPFPGETPQAFALIASVALQRSRVPVLGSTRRILLELDETENNAEAPIAIDNLGGGELTYSLESEDDWLELSETSGTAPSTATVRVDVASLPRADQYLGTLRLRSSDPNGDRTIGVVVQRACTAACDALDACDRVPLEGLIGEAVAYGSIDATDSALSGSCGGDDSPEVSFSWRAPSDDVFEFRVHPAGATLYVFSGGCAGAELACEPASSDRALRMTLEDGQALTLVVDAAHAQSFALDIMPAGAREACAEDGAACEDGDPCTLDDTCIGGLCAGRALECADQDRCSAGRCEPRTLAEPTPDDDAGRLEPDAGALTDDSVDAGAPPATKATGCGCRTVATSRQRARLAPIGVGLWILCIAMRRRTRRAHEP